MQVESWERKGKLDRARDVLQACELLHLPAVPEDLRAPWEKKIRDLDARLPDSTWASSRTGGDSQPVTPSKPTATPQVWGASDLQGGEHAPAASRSPVWGRLGKALDDRSTDFVVLAVDAFRARFDFVAAESGVQVWVTVQTAKERAWNAFSGSRFIREAHAIAPGAREFVSPQMLPGGASGWLLVWVFTSIPDARAEVKDEFLASSPELAPMLTVGRHPLPTEAEFDREVERLGSRSYRPGHGHKRFAVTTCAKCGQPLSDPRSVVLGIGPDCLKYFDPKVLAAAKTWKPGSVRTLGRTPSEYFSGIADEW
jgi:hypothetical protein